MLDKWITQFLMVFLAACSLSAEPNTAIPGVEEYNEKAIPIVHPLSGLHIINLDVITDDHRHTFKVELAHTDNSQARGLMFRTELGDFEGMLFPSFEPRERSFWMKNTPLSLDVIFVGDDGKITNIVSNTVPFSMSPIRSSGLASAVLEIRAGRAETLGISAGDKVEYESPF